MRKTPRKYVLRNAQLIKEDANILANMKNPNLDKDGFCKVNEILYYPASSGLIVFGKLVSKTFKLAGHE